MFSVLLICLIVLILVAILYALFSGMFGSNDSADTDNDDDEEEDLSAAEDIVRSNIELNERTNNNNVPPQRFQMPPYEPRAKVREESSGQYTTHNDRNGRTNNNYVSPQQPQTRPYENRPYEPRVTARDVNSGHYTHNDHHERVRFQRPVTPVQTNHYRPVTPVQQIRPITPVQQIRPITPVAVDQRARIASPTGVPSYRQINNALSNIASEMDSDFKTYNELSEEERATVANLSQCMIDVEQSLLDPFLERINARGNGRSAQYVVGKFDKTHDAQLTPSQRFIRKSFKIKNKRTKTCRFARFRIRDSGSSYYRLVFHDYTPYVEEHAPKFDVFNQERDKERSHWENVRVMLHYNSELMNVSHMLILVPGGKARS